MRRGFQSKITNPNFLPNKSPQNPFPQTQNSYKSPLGNRNNSQQSSTSNSSKTILLKLRQARSSGTINISNLHLTEIPSEIFDPNVNIPDLNWWEMVDITKLDASNNNLSENSFDNDLHNIGNLSYLTSLRFSNNNFTSLPESLYSLSNLKLLDVSNNKITSLNAEHIKSLCSLVELDISKNELREIPEGIQYLTYLEILTASNNRLISIPNGLRALHRLKKLYIDNNAIQYIPPEIFVNMNCLEELYMFKNRIDSLINNNNISLCDNLKKLKFLDLHCNNLTSITFNVELPLLDSLLLSYNQISKIFGIDKCFNLTNLDLNNNKIEFFPREILFLKKLNTLNIQNNSINELPNTLGLMNCLVRLNIEGNPLRRLVSKMKNANTESLKRYLKTRITDKDLEDSDVEKKEFYDINIEQPQNQNITQFILNSTLTMSGVELKEIPVNEFNIYIRKNTLDKIDFSNNKLDNIYSFANILPLIQSLKEINLSNNMIANFPICILYLPNLATLNLSKNKICLFPYERLTSTNIVDLKCNIVYLDISFNQLSSLPEIIGLYTELSTLILMNNKISNINSIENMKLNKLDTINLGNNQIDRLPRKLYRSIPNIKILNLENNNLKDIPTDFCLLGNINVINFYGNAIKKIRNELLSNAKNLIEYLKRLHQYDHEDRVFEEKRNNVQMQMPMNVNVQKDINNNTNSNINFNSNFNSNSNNCSNNNREGIGASSGGMRQFDNNNVNNNMMMGENDIDYSNSPQDMVNKLNQQISVIEGELSQPNLPMFKKNDLRKQKNVLIRQRAQYLK